MTFLCFNLPNVYGYLGGKWFAFRYVALVAVGRVFYHCHYFGDTLAGGILGMLIGNLLEANGSRKLSLKVAEMIVK